MNRTKGNRGEATVAVYVVIAVLGLATLGINQLFKSSHAKSVVAIEEKAAAAAPQQSPSAAATVALPRLSALAACPQLVQVSWCSLVMVVCLVCL